MVARFLLIALLAVASSSAVRARELNSRQLQQGSETCPPGCAAGECQLDAIYGGYKCTLCKSNLLIEVDTGKCSCPDGHYLTGLASNPSCSPCGKNFYCEGSRTVIEDPNTKALSVGSRTACPGVLLTRGTTSTSINACRNPPGYRYTFENNVPGASLCTGNTFSIGMYKQRACAPCPPDYVIIDTGAADFRRTSQTQCVVPAGYFASLGGVVSECPQGSYRRTSDSASTCQKCKTGVTTDGGGKTLERFCTVLIAGYYATQYSSEVITETAPCPQNKFCPGGAANQVFTGTEFGENTRVTECPDGTWTPTTGAASSDQCMTPPGYWTGTKKINNVDTVGTYTCDDGFYRPDWKPSTQATACLPCGSGISSQGTEAVDGVPDFVRGSKGSCYIKAGQGMTYSADTDSYSAVTCDGNRYGVESQTFGLEARPCISCPTGMKTNTAHKNGETGGFTRREACGTKKGYGFNGRIAIKCPKGSWNGEDTRLPCTQCDPMKTTVVSADDGVGQAATTDCKVQEGYGYYDNQLQPCPIGYYRAFNGSAASQPACDPCPNNRVTSAVGGKDVDDCNACAAGYGATRPLSGSATIGSGCSACGGGAATYGASTRDPSVDAVDAGITCATCPTISTPYAFYKTAVDNKAWTPIAVARTKASSAGDCLAQYTQLGDNGAWYMGGTVPLTTVVPAPADFPACVAACTDEQDCQYVTYDYSTDVCKMKKVVAAASNTVLAFKALLATADANGGRRLLDETVSNTTTAKGLQSGSYTMWRDAGENVGTPTTFVTTSRKACLAKCDGDNKCAAVVMTAVDVTNDSIASCKLISGDDTPATLMRSVTRVHTNRLKVTDTAVGIAV